MRTRNGKIARLPRPIREQINERLECCQSSSEILEWLNALPEVRELVQKNFDGAPISRQNLSQWHLGGFQEALVRRDLALDVRDMSEVVAEMEEQQPDTRLVDNAATILAAKLGALAVNWNGDADERLQTQVKILNSIARTLVQMQRERHSAQRDVDGRQAAREQKEKEKIEETKQKLTGRWFDSAEARIMGKLFGGGTAGHKIASYILSVRRGNLDAQIGLVDDDTFADGKPLRPSTPSNPVKPCQSDSSAPSEKAD